MLARRSTFAGAMPRVLTSAAKSRTTCRVAGDRLRSIASGGEIDAVERARERRRRRVEAKTVGAHRAGEHQHQAGGAVLQIVERLRIGGRRVGMIDALHDGPGRAGRAPAKRSRCGVARIKRLDGQAVMGPAFEPRERRALEHGIDQAAPSLFRCRRKIGGRGRVLRIRHRCKVPCRGPPANQSGRAIGVPCPRA